MPFYVFNGSGSGGGGGSTISGLYVVGSVCNSAELDTIIPTLINPQTAVIVECDFCATTYTAPNGSVVSGQCFLRGQQLIWTEDGWLASGENTIISADNTGTCPNSVGIFDSISGGVLHFKKIFSSDNSISFSQTAGCIDAKITPIPAPSICSLFPIVTGCGNPGGCLVTSVENEVSSCLIPYLKDKLAMSNIIQDILYAKINDITPSYVETYSSAYINSHFLQATPGTGGIPCISPTGQLSHTTVSCADFTSIMNSLSCLPPLITAGSIANGAVLTYNSGTGCFTPTLPSGGGGSSYSFSVNGSNIPSGGQLNITGCPGVIIGTTTSGSITNVSICVDPVVLSDRNKKQNIKDLTGYGMETIMKMNPVSYEYKDMYDYDLKYNKDKISRLGFIAQELENILPEAVKTEIGGANKVVDPMAIISVLVKAVQELININNKKE